MLGVTDLWMYAVGAALITLMPGPNSIYTLSMAARCGVRAGYRAAFGIFLGDTVLMALSAAGVVALLRAYSAVFSVGKYAGAGYLAYVGSRMAQGAWRRWQAAEPATGAGHRSRPGRGWHRWLGGRHSSSRRPQDARLGVPSPRHTVVDLERTPSLDVEKPFRHALLISLLNPKMILFFLSYFAQFVDPRYPYPALSFAALGSVIQLFSLLYLTTLIFAGSFLARQFRQRHRLAAAVMVLAGAVFVGFGMRLMTASLV